eukprot:TRINITY_DN15516_c0_g1_i1.p1 TRINITY_DN15516_c0_g1~~TRINITY_DN15516_c0_g1_i1.p1  ORF type:complete len:652 (+),score=145.52 TRINITY_DN15516_c0_g1_i1:559-2514(+)
MQRENTQLRRALETSAPPAAPAGSAPDAAAATPGETVVGPEGNPGEPVTVASGSVVQHSGHAWSADYCRAGPVPFAGSVQFAVSAPEVKRVRAGGYAAGHDQWRVVVTLRALGGWRGAVLQLRWSGAALVHADATEFSPGVYTATCRMTVPGAYTLQGLLMWESSQRAYGPVYPHSSFAAEVLSRKAFGRSAVESYDPRLLTAQETRPLCRRLRRDDDGAVPPYAASGIPPADLSAYSLAQVTLEAAAAPPRTPPPCPGGFRAPVTAAPSTGVSASSGSWRAIAGVGNGSAAAHSFVWEPHRCAMKWYDAEATRRCLAPTSEGGGGRRVLFVGDSHTQRLWDAIRLACLHSCSSPKLPFCAGCADRIASGFVYQSCGTTRADPHAGSLLPFHGLLRNHSGARWQGERSGENVLKVEAAVASAMRSGFTHIVLGFGHHDLRDVTAGTYTSDVAHLLARLSLLQMHVGWRGRLVWRFPPAMAFKKLATSLVPLTMWPDFRSNEKLLMTATQIAEHIQLLARDFNSSIGTHDSLAITLPRAQEPVDTHHYMAGGCASAMWQSAAESRFETERRQEAAAARDEYGGKGFQGPKYNADPPWTRAIPGVASNKQLPDNWFAGGCRAGHRIGSGQPWYCNCEVGIADTQAFLNGLCNE